MKHLKLYSAIFCIIVITLLPLWKAVLDVSDAVLISIITGIGGIAGTFTLVEYHRRKKSEMIQPEKYEDPNQEEP